MGTVPFMSPEQLRGKILDQRTDIFSLGSLLYEMVSGKPAFTRENNAEAIAAILNDEPDWSRISAPLRPILQKCLAKDKAGRYDSARILARDLESVRNSGSLDEPVRTHDTAPTRRIATTDILTTKKRQFHFWQSSGGDSPSQAKELDSGHVAVAGTRRFGPVALAAVAVILLLFGATAILVWKATQANDTPNFDALRPVKLISWKTGTSANSKDFRVSHDGKYIAYSASRQGGNDAIYIKQTSDGEEVRVTKDGWKNVSPLWAPDDQSIAFVSYSPDHSGVYKIPTLGGPATPLIVQERGVISLRHWAHDGSTIFYEQMGNLYRLDLATNEVTKLTQLADRYNDRDFGVSPDETQLVFCDTRDGQTDIWTIAINGGKLTQITNNKDMESRPLWHPDGRRIIYNVYRNDLEQINFTTVGGTPVQVTRGDGDYVMIGISGDGDRLYYSSAVTRSDIGSVDLDSLGQFEVAAEPAGELWADPSPDGLSIVFQSNSRPHAARKMYDSALMVKSSDGQTRQLAGNGDNPRWLPDSRHISIFRLTDEMKGEYAVWLIDAVTGEEKRLTSESVMPASYSLMPITRVETSVLDFSPDGRVVYLDKQRPRNVKIGSLNGGEFTSLTKNENPNLEYFSPQFSNDGSRVAIASLERFRDKAQRSVWRVKVSESDVVKDIFSTTDALRLIGWTSTGGVALATAEQPMVDNPMELNIIAVALDGTSSKLHTLKDVYPRTLTISSDGRTIAFTARQDDRDNVWTLALGGAAEPRKVTSNADSALFLTNLAFSANGKMIYFDKQEETSTISRFENFE
jgi:Tol biopolymer transport system component